MLMVNDFYDNNNKEWNFNFGIYANDDSVIDTKKCDELMDSIINWIEKNNMSCGGGFEPYADNNDHYDAFYDNEKSQKEEICQCSNVSSIVMMSRYNENPLVCLVCNNFISPERINIDVDTTAELQQWRVVYDSIDRLWLESGAYELWATQELSNPQSLLHKEGFELQNKMQKYGKCYYWWFQDITRKEPLSHCPKCGEVLENIGHRVICEACLLVM
jgi:hypothetical protein